MKNNWYLLIALILPSFVFGQKARIKSESVKVKYIQLPTNPMPEDYRFYSVSVDNNSSELTAMGHTTSSLNQAIDIPGFVKKNDGGNFQVKIVAEPGHIAKAEPNSRIVETKDKEGNVTKTKYYNYKTTFCQPIVMKVVDEQQNVIAEKVYGSCQSPVKFASEEFTSSKEAWKGYQEGITKAMSKQVNQSLGSIAGFLVASYGYPRRREVDQFMTIGTKKHPKFDDFNKAFEQAKKYLEQVSYHTLPEPGADDLLAAMTSWEQWSQEFKASDKHGVKVKEACLYNLANAYFWLENIEKSKEYLQALEDMDSKNKYTNSLHRKINNVTIAFDRNKTNTRHFDRTYEEAAFKQ